MCVVFVDFNATACDATRLPALRAEVQDSLVRVTVDCSDGTSLHPLPSISLANRSLFAFITNAGDTSGVIVSQSLRAFDTLSQIFC